MGLGRLGMLLVLAALAAVTATAGAAATGFMPGASGVGDPLYPRAGNGGYEVDHYDLDLRYRPATNHLDGRARISATAEQDLSRFDLDYRGPRIRSLEVDGRRASFQRSEQELVVTPGAGLPKGSRFEIVVRYRGRPHYLVDPDGLEDGWVRTDDGAFVAGEPQGSTTWFPCNDHPSDKATYAIRIEVPRGVEAISNGELLRHRTRGRWTTWSWREREPMITYLATASIGQFRIDRARIAGHDSIVAVDPRELQARRALSKMPNVIRLFSSLFGPYPFSEAGAVVDHLRHGPTALETQTRPSFPQASGRSTVAHELAHQWFGDNVGIAAYSDMWLNEGFATWAEWRWRQARGRATLRHTFKRFMRIPASHSGFWNPPPAAIERPKGLFADSVYVRGAMALEALRRKVGNRTFLATMRSWEREHAFGTATVKDFTALAERKSHEDLRPLFRAWLYQRGKPRVGASRARRTAGTGSSGRGRPAARPARG